MPIDVTPCIPEIVDVRSNILVDFLVVLARVVDVVPGGAVHHHVVDRRNDFCWGSDWISARWIGDSSLSSRKVPDPSGSR